MIARPFCAAALAAVGLVPALAEETSCLSLEVHGPAATLELVCDAARATHGALAECGLDWPAGTRIDVVETIPDAPPGCIGRYDCDAGEIVALSPGALAGRTDLKEDFGDLEVERLFHSLIAHELSHAALDREPGRPYSVATQEYVAYVMQLSALSVPERLKVLAPWPEPATLDFAGLNEFILALSPGLFMSRAWHHFSHPKTAVASSGSWLTARHCSGFRTCSR